MSLYVGLDVSQKETEICVIDEEGRRIWRGRCPTRPESIAQVLQRHAPQPTRVGMETGPLAIWLWHSLRALDSGGDRLAVLAQGIAHRAERRLGYRLHRPMLTDRLSDTQAVILSAASQRDDGAILPCPRPSA